MSLVPASPSSAAFGVRPGFAFGAERKVDGSPYSVVVISRVATQRVAFWAFGDVARLLTADARRMMGSGRSTTSGTMSVF